jgi:hypothetical protein
MRDGDKMALLFVALLAFLMFRMWLRMAFGW